MISLKVSIVIYDTKLDLLNKCISSIKHSFNIQSRIEIVDHGKIDLKNTVENKANDVYYFHNPSNPGYGAGNNSSITRSILEKYRYHLVINPDVYFEPNVLNGLLQIMEVNSKVGLVSPKIFSQDGELQYLCKLIPKPIDLILSLILPQPFKKILLNKFQLRFSKYNSRMLVPNLSGCFMLIRVSYLQQVGLFDQRFFLHMEDIDLSRRLFNVCDCVFVPDFKITHLHNAESKRSLKAFIIHLSSSIRYFNKWGWFRDKNRDYLNSKVLLENWPGNHFGK